MRRTPPLFFGLLVLALAAPAPAAPPEVPAQISYQGVLLDDQGSPRTGFVELTIRIYDALSGGTLLYTQPFSGTPLAEGTFTLVIGPYGVATDTPVDPLTTDLATVFSGDLVAGPDRFLEISVDLSLALSRIQILSAPFALRAESATSADTADSAEVAQETIMVSGLPSEVVSEIYQHFNFDGGGPPNDDPTEGMGDPDGDGIANFVDTDNDDDGWDDQSEINRGSDINLVTPRITSFDPPSTPALFPPATVSVLGTNFEPGMSVVFGTETPTPVNVTPTSFDVSVGPQPAGSVDVQVTRLNGETYSASFFDFGTLPSILHGVSGLPRFKTLSVRDQTVLLGKSLHGYKLVPGSSFSPQRSGEADQAFDPAGVVSGVSCKLTDASTCQVRFDADSDGDDYLASTEFTEIQTFAGDSPSLLSAALAFGPGGEPAAAYATGVLTPLLSVAVVVAHDRDGNGDFAGTNEVVSVEAWANYAEVEVTVDSAGRIATTYLRSGVRELRVAWDRSGDGDFDDTVSGNPERTPGLATWVSCFDAVFDGNDRLAVTFSNSAGHSLLRDLNGDGDFEDAGESVSLGAAVDGCAITRTAGGSLAIVQHGPIARVLVDRDADGDFDGIAEDVALPDTTPGTPVGIATNELGQLYIGVDSQVFIYPSF